MRSNYGIIIPYVDGDKETPNFFSFSGWLWRLKSKDFNNVIERIKYILIIKDQKKEEEDFFRSSYKQNVNTIIEFAKQYSVSYGYLSKSFYETVKRKKLVIKNSVDLLFELIYNSKLKEPFLSHITDIEGTHEINEWVILEGDQKFGTLSLSKNQCNGGIKLPLWRHALGSKIFNIYVPLKENSVYKKEIKVNKSSYHDLTEILKY